MKYFILFLFLVGVQVYGNVRVANRLCQKWNCIDEKLNLTGLAKDQLIDVLRSNLPDDWHGEVDTIVNNCYENRNGKYSHGCPGQPLLYCVVVHLNMNCPTQYWKHDDGCASVQSLSISTANYMFSQSRYNNLEKNLAIERRPEAFMRNYFSNKCCGLPSLFNATLEQCGYKKLMHYHVFEIQKKSYDYSYTSPQVPTAATMKVENLRTEFNSIMYEEPFDPLDCCDLNNFIQPSWRSDCDFNLKWDDENRFTIVNVSESVTTTTELQRSVKNSDAKMVPNSCEQQNCVFNKLNITSGGVVNKELFSKLLDNMTDKHPEWTSSKVRVMTQCLKKPLIGYEEDCEINKILACTFDILSENCPNQNKNDPCKHSTSTVSIDGVICQISSSKYRPKHRREFCTIPDFIPSYIRSECGVDLIYKLEYVPQPAVKSSAWGDVVNCKDLTESSKCILNKMDVFNKYGFIDRFKMKNRISQYSQDLPPLYEDMYKNILETAPLYKNHCSTSRKLLNIIDAIFTTCPYLKFKKNEKCTNLMTNIKRLSNIKSFEYKQSLDKKKPRTFTQSSYKTGDIQTYKSNLYNFGILGSDAPQVEVIDLKSTEKTLVLLPVYKRTKDPLAINSLHNDGIFRS